MAQKKDENKEILPDVKNIKSQETYTLPSRGILYSENDNIPASITLRRMTTKEDKIRLRNSSEDKIRRDILQACILNEGVNAGNLKLMDANFLLFRLRSLSLLRDDYKLSLICPYCQTHFIHEINLSEVPVKFVEEDRLKDLELILPLSKQKITFKYPSLDNIINMGDKLREYFTQFPNVDKSEAIFTIGMMIYIGAVNGEYLISEELENWVDSLDIIDSRAIRNRINKLDEETGFENNLVTICPNCKKEVTHGLPITSELFSPSDDK